MSPVTAQDKKKLFLKGDLAHLRGAAALHRLRSTQDLMGWGGSWAGAAGSHHAGSTKFSTGKVKKERI